VKPGEPTKLLAKMFWLWQRFTASEVIRYLIAGVLTTLVNLVVFSGLTRLFGKGYWFISNFPAVVLSILFAFVINRLWVFRSTGPVIPELLRFLASRAAISLSFEYGLMFLLYNILGLKQEWMFFSWPMPVSKLLTQVLVVIGNYILGKWLVFRQGKGRDRDEL
jgi:putative flippase GtrA